LVKPRAFDELLLGLATLILARWKDQRQVKSRGHDGKG
jgi:hypothetical protein